MYSKSAVEVDEKGVWLCSLMFGDSGVVGRLTFEFPVVVLVLVGVRSSMSGLGLGRVVVRLGAGRCPRLVWGLLF